MATNRHTFRKLKKCMDELTENADTSNELTFNFLEITPFDKLTARQKTALEHSATDIDVVDSHNEEPQNGHPETTQELPE